MIISRVYFKNMPSSMYGAASEWALVNGLREKSGEERWAQTRADPTCHVHIIHVSSHPVIWILRETISKFEDDGYAVWDLRSNLLFQKNSTGDFNPPSLSLCVCPRRTF